MRLQRAVEALADLAFNVVAIRQSLERMDPLAVKSRVEIAVARVRELPPRGSRA